MDIPSGVRALTGEAFGDVLPATATVTFAALKPGLLFPPGAGVAGRLELADIGLGAGVAAHADADLVQAADVARWVPRRDTTAHKWRAAVRVIAGSTGMTGAARLAAVAAMRTGVGMVHLSAPGTPRRRRQRWCNSCCPPPHGHSRCSTPSIASTRAVGPGLGREPPGRWRRHVHSPSRHPCRR